MKQPVICPVALSTELVGDETVTNRTVVVLKVIEALMFIREQTDRPFHEERKNQEQTDNTDKEQTDNSLSMRGGIKERKRREFMASMFQIMDQIERMIRLPNVIEIAIVIGANICNPKEMWRFKLGDIDRNTTTVTSALKVLLSLL